MSESRRDVFNKRSVVGAFIELYNHKDIWGKPTCLLSGVKGWHGFVPFNSLWNTVFFHLFSQTNIAHNLDSCTRRKNVPIYVRSFVCVKCRTRTSICFTKTCLNSSEFLKKSGTCLLKFGKPLKKMSTTRELMFTPLSAVRIYGDFLSYARCEEGITLPLKKGWPLHGHDCQPFSFISNNRYSHRNDILLIILLQQQFNSCSKWPVKRYQWM